MTIITKTSDKKKLLPVPTAPIASPSTASSVTDEEASVVYARYRARTATLLVCLLGVLVLLTGVLAGVCFYRQYLRERVQRINFYMPYEPEDLSSKDNLLLNSRWHDGPFSAEPYSKTNDKSSEDNDDNDDDDDDDGDFDAIQHFLQQLMAQFKREIEEDPVNDHRMESEMSDLEAIRNRFFREDVLIKDDEEESYADINIPDFRDGRRGRFIHDYKNNQTTIVDEDARRCFVYPLDYTTTLPPKSMLDAIVKMQSGYYFPDTNVLRKKMRVVTPELEKDDDYLSLRTRSVCMSKRIYKLEPFVGGVFKRSIMVNDDHAKFAEFSGNKIVEFDFVNYGELLKYEGLAD